MCLRWAGKMLDGGAMQADMIKSKIVVIGATGRLGGIMQHQAARNGVSGRFIWQSRHNNQAKSGCWINWDPDAGANPAARLASAIQRAATGLPVCVLNLAGATPARANLPAESMEISNVGLAKQIMNAATLAKVSRVMFASSAAVYGRPETGQPPFAETAKISPLNAYGKSKVRMENWVRKNTPSGISASLLRIGNVAGSDALLGQLIRNTDVKPLEFTVDRFASENGPRRSYIGPESLFDVLVALADCTTPLAQVINIASQPAVTMDALLDAWINQRPKDLNYRFQPAPEQAIETVVLNTGILRNSIGKGAKDCSAAEIVAQTIRHYFERVK